MCLLDCTYREEILQCKESWKKLYIDKGLTKIEASSIVCEELWVDYNRSITKSNRDWIKWIKGIKKVVLYGTDNSSKKNIVLYRGISRDIKVKYIENKEPVSEFFN